MFDLFGKRRIRQLEESLETKDRLFDIQQKGWRESDERTLEAQITIREMDQQIYNMSQCQSWTQMQPIFAELLADTMHRKNDESKRMEAVLLPEMRKAYGGHR